jgi:predicted nucleic acid-binding protein
MRPSTEDLLSTRDGEPLPAATRVEIEASPESAREVERLRAVQRSLQNLPELAPPAGAWERILAAEQRTSAARRRIVRSVAGLGVAAAAAVVAVIVFVAGPTDDTPLRIVRDRTSFTIVGDLQNLSPAAEPVAYAAIAAESARLERLLADMPRAPVTRLGTVSTIVGIEEQIALLDEQLSYGDAIGLEGPQRAVLWSERVDLMNALVLVRSVDAQANVLEPFLGETL